MEGLPWIDPEGIMLNEIMKPNTETGHKTSHDVKPTEKEITFVVTRGRGRERSGGGGQHTQTSSPETNAYQRRNVPQDGYNTAARYTGRLLGEESLRS